MNKITKHKYSWVHLFALYCFVCLCPSCTPPTYPSSWQDTGDYYSHNEGLLWRNEEYHERIISFRNGMMMRSVGVSISEGEIKLWYNSYWLSSKPWGGGGSRVDLSLKIVVDSLTYSDKLKYPFGEKADVMEGAGLVKDVDVRFVSDAEYKVIGGWISFEYGDNLHMSYDGAVCSYKMQKILFELQVEDANGVQSNITDGYVYGNSSDWK